MARSVPVRALVVFLTGMAVLAFGVAAWLLTPGGPTQPSSTTSTGAARIGGPFALIDQHGRPRSDREFRGRYLLLTFGYTYCPDVCPTSLMTMTAALDLLAGADPALARQVVPLLITVDPERDTVEVLAAYAAHFHETLVALTGPPAQIAAAAEAYRVYYAKAEVEGAGDYLMDHSAFIYLMGPDGRYLTHFSPGVTPEAITEALKTKATAARTD